MAFNGSGTYNLPAGNPVVTGTTISSSTTNTTNSDIATALTNCITRDGQSTPSANLPMNAKKLTGLAAGTSAGDSVRYEQVVLSASLGTNVATFLATPSSANLATALTDETGSGAAVFATSPTLVTPVLGTPSSGNLSSCTNAVGYGLKSASTIVSVSAATAPTTGQSLVATSSTTATWQTPSGGGSWTYLSTVTASASATVDIETTFDSTYDVYVIVATNIVTSTDGGELRCRPKVAGAYDSTAANFAFHLTLNSSSNSAYSGLGIALNTLSYWRIFDEISNSGGKSASLQMYVSNPSVATKQKHINWQGVAGATAGQSRAISGAGTHLNDTNALTGIRFYPASGTITTGTFRLYGIKNS
jgi:hypothetical protein